MNENKTIKIRKINDVKVEPIPLPKHTGKILGYEMIPEVYSNIFLCAVKQSGKTNCLFTILKECVGKNTKIIAFVGTLKNDPNWKYIREYFEKKKNPVVGRISLKDDDGTNELAELVYDLKLKANDEEEEEKKKSKEGVRKKKLEVPEGKEEFAIKKFMKWDDDKVEEAIPEPKKKKNKILAPEYVIIFDDLSDQLKDKCLTTLMKQNRHFKAKIIVSTQYLKDVLPESRKQCDIWILFRGLPEAELKIIYANSSQKIPLKLFMNLYEKATEKPFSFFYIDKNNREYRRNFNEVFDLEKEKKNMESEETKKTQEPDLNSLIQNYLNSRV
jgi:hypothetical protein